MADETWFAAFDEDTRKYITDRGLAEKKPEEAFLEAAKAHREAQAFIGVPKDQLLRLPKDETDIAGWEAVYERLGAPKDKAAYDFAPVKFTDGTELTQAQQDWMRNQAASLKLSPTAAQKMAGEMVKFWESETAAESAEDQAAAATAMENLRKSWGQNYDANRVIADRAYAGLMAAAGLTQEQMTAAIQKLGEATGKTETMQLLLAAGMKMGEHTFVGGGPSGGGNGALFTRESAAARINELKADTEWTRRLLNGSAAEVKEFNNLSQIAYGEAA